MTGGNDDKENNILLIVDEGEDRSQCLRTQRITLMRKMRISKATRHPRPEAEGKSNLNPSSA